MPRILLVLAAARAENAAEALRSAAVHADEPELLSLGLAAPEGEVPVPEEGRAPVRLLREACSASSPTALRVSTSRIRPFFTMSSRPT